MKTAGRIAVLVGIVLTIAGLVIGFSNMFADEDQKAIEWLGLVPLGFVVMLAGTVASQLFGSKDNN